ncbi:MAG: hypothetical protein AAB425_13935, partial [Bdellovibrionota bacterium]
WAARTKLQAGTQGEVLGWLSPLYGEVDRWDESVRLAKIMANEGRTATEIWRGRLQLGASIGGAGNPRRGIEMMEAVFSDPASAPFFQSMPRITFHMLRFLAALYFKNGQAVKSSQIFERLENELHTWKYSYDPDLAIRLLWDLKNMGALSRSQERTLNSYPALPWDHAGVQQLGARSGHCGGAAESNCEIDLTTDEYRVGDEKFYSIPLELRLVGLVVQAGRVGLHANLAFELLWPKAIQLYSLLPDRLNKLLSRARHFHGYQIDVKDSVLTLATSQRQTPCVRFGPLVCPSFFRGRTRFTRHELETYYNVGRTRSLVHLSDWKARAWVERQGKAWIIKA